MNYLLIFYVIINYIYSILTLQYQKNRDILFSNKTGSIIRITNINYLSEFQEKVQKSHYLIAFFYTDLCDTW